MQEKDFIKACVIATVLTSWCATNDKFVSNDAKIGAVGILYGSTYLGAKLFNFHPGWSLAALLFTDMTSEIAREEQPNPLIFFSTLGTGILAFYKIFQSSYK